MILSTLWKVLWTTRFFSSGYLFFVPAATFIKNHAVENFLFPQFVHKVIPNENLVIFCKKGIKYLKFSAISVIIW